MVAERELVWMGMKVDLLRDAGHLERGDGVVDQRDQPGAGFIILGRQARAGAAARPMGSFMVSLIRLSAVVVALRLVGSRS